MAHGILPFRIPFFRIFYSTTYTLLYVIALLLLAITPATLIWTAITARCLQYPPMIGAVYFLVAVLSIFIYTSRLYTNRTVLAAVGKAYIPIEAGDVSRKVRKMVSKQLERSAIVAWESRPRDLEGEILQAGVEGLLPVRTLDSRDSRLTVDDDYTLGRIITISPSNPPWGHVAHPGWTSPSHRADNATPGVECANVLAELPNLIEAQAVSLAPADPTMTPQEESDDQVVTPDPAVVDLLRRPSTMGMRDYLTQLSYLGLMNPASVGQNFLTQYERARFCGRPITAPEFSTLMATFAELLAGMTELTPAIIEQIRLQTETESSEEDSDSLTPSLAGTPPPSSLSRPYRATPSPSATRSPASSNLLMSPVTARERPGSSRSGTPFTPAPTPSQQFPQQQLRGNASVETFGSVIHTMDVTSPLGNDEEGGSWDDPSVLASSDDAASWVSLPSDAGSVVWHSEHGARG